MGPITNQIINARKEKNCITVTPERKYYKDGQTWVKRSLRPDEWQVNPCNGQFLVPRMGRERILNEAASIRFIAEKTNIPVPKLYCCFEDNEAVYLVMEYVEGVGMNELPEEERKIVESEVVPPYRVMHASPRMAWAMKPREANADNLVFCHNDLSTYNIIVDPETLKINAIIDWEYAGFYTEPFEGHFFLRNAPSVAQEGEVVSIRFSVYFFYQFLVHWREQQSVRMWCLLDGSCHGLGIVGRHGNDGPEGPNLGLRHSCLATPGVQGKGAGSCELTLSAAICRSCGEPLRSRKLRVIISSGIVTQVRIRWLSYSEQDFDTAVVLSIRRNILMHLVTDISRKGSRPSVLNNSIEVCSCEVPAKMFFTDNWIDQTPSVEPS
ncbi:hypothetical protein FH972_026720 [Carpinus fangiana]|uniref:Aminoglycoside phosphotransferase domain-containing protein n=1 Tax=Carpinus fangiana TaxID=176857 RepID=A0A5N6L4X2_9ROSI|nr:hypothetical protein FH972_026720 [Carpinus fangiana]